MMRFGLKEKTIHAINQVFEKYQVEQALLYGSRAKGDFRTNSDIDLTLTGKNINLTVLLKIETELDDLLLPYKIDLSVLDQIQNAGLREQIRDAGVVFYKKHKSDLKHQQN